MAKDLTGEVFIWLRAGEKTGKTYRNSPVYSCRCLCGHTVEVPAIHLRNGVGGCCGYCLITLAALRDASHSAEGMKVARITILGDTGKTVRNSPLIACRCDCGKEFTASLAALRSARTIACPACQVELAREGFGLRG